MNGKIIYQHRIYRQDLQNNPDVLYVFGDNTQRVGLGGQAGQMRGEPNAIGVATKIAPGMSKEDFFSDKPGEMEQIKKELSLIADMLERGYAVVVPSDGIGTGLSELPDRAPKIHAMIIHFFTNLGFPPPWK
jgi:hypothetical protein